MTAEEMNSKLLKCILGRTNEDQDPAPPEQCSSCSKCPDCKLMKEYGAYSMSAYEEQAEIEKMIYFEPNKDGTGQYFCPLPFAKDPGVLKGNRIQAEKYVNSLIKIARKSPEDTEGIKKAFVNLVDQGFLVKAESLPEGNEPGGKNDVMTNPEAHFIPNTIAWKENSKSTSCRICFDGSRKCNKDYNPI